MNAPDASFSGSLGPVRRMWAVKRVCRWNGENASGAVCAGAGDGIRRETAPEGRSYGPLVTANRGLVSRQRPIKGIEASGAGGRQTVEPGKIGHILKVVDVARHSGSRRRPLYGIGRQPKGDDRVAGLEIILAGFGRARGLPGGGVRLVVKGATIISISSWPQLSIS